VISASIPLALLAAAGAVVAVAAGTVVAVGAAGAAVAVGGAGGAVGGAAGAAVGDGAGALEHARTVAGSAAKIERLNWRRVNATLTLPLLLVTKGQGHGSLTNPLSRGERGLVREL
jgi:hypothetical protein